MSRKNNQFSYKDSVSLKEFFLSKIEDLEDESRVRFKLMDKALDLAQKQLEHRLEGMNEFRDQLNKQAATFVTRTEMNLKIEALDKGRRDNFALMLSLIALVISILFKFI